MQKTINENISMGNTIIQASNIEPKFKIDPIQFKECVFYEIWTIKNPQNTSYTLSAERCQTAFLSNKELIKYADPSFVMGNFTKDNQENILGIKAVKEELSKPSYVTDVKSYKFISDKYKILENGNYIYILQNFKAKSEILGEYTQNAHIIFDNKGNVIKIELNQNKEFGSYWLKLQFKFKVERKIICRKNTTFYFSFATFYFSADTCAVLFALTGIAYILGADQDTGLKVETYKLVKNIEPGKEKDALIQYLQENNLKVPSDAEATQGKGKGANMGGIHHNANAAPANVKAGKGKNNEITIGGAHYSANITPVAQNEYVITLKTRSLLGDMIMLHKDKGAWYFSVLSIGFGIALFLLYISGLIITLFASKKDRQKQLATLGAGVVITILLAYLSL